MELNVFMGKLHSIQGGIRYDTHLGHDAVRDAGSALGVEAVHHGPHHLELVADAEVEEVGVHEHVVGRTQGRVVLEPQGRRGLVHLGKEGEEEEEEEKEGAEEEEEEKGGVEEEEEEKEGRRKKREKKRRGVTGSGRIRLRFAARVLGETRDIERRLKASWVGEGDVREGNGLFFLSCGSENPQPNLVMLGGWEARWR